jgi:hypothetical protein
LPRSEPCGWATLAVAVAVAVAVADADDADDEPDNATTAADPAAIRRVTSTRIYPVIVCRNSASAATSHAEAQ